MVFYVYRSRGGNTVQYMALLYYGVSFHFLYYRAHVFKGSKEKTKPTKLLEVLWHLIFASSVCRKGSLIHISNVKENITVSSSALFNRTEQNTQEGRLL